MKACWDCCGGGKSMLEKSRARSRTKKYLHRNLASGHVTPSQHYLERAGLRGRKLWLCCALVWLLLLLALAHLAVTCMILGILGFGSTGFTRFTFTSTAMIWPRGGNLSNITIATPHGVSGFRDTPLSVTTAAGGEIRSEAHYQRRTASRVSLVGSAVDLRTGEAIGVRNKDGRQLLFGNSSLLQVDALSVTGTVATHVLTTPMMGGVSEIDSSQHLTLQGEGGVTARGGMVNITAGGGVTLSARQRLLLSGERGVLMPGLTRTSTTSHHLCATHNGTFFLVPANPLRCLRTT